MLARIAYALQLGTDFTPSDHGKANRDAFLSHCLSPSRLRAPRLLLISPDLRVQSARQHAFHLRQQFSADERVHSKRVRAGERGRHVEAKDRTGDSAQLPRELFGKIPDLPTFDRLRTVQDGGAFAAGAATGSAILVAPAEVPFGEGAEPFFSASSRSPLDT